MGSSVGTLGGVLPPDLEGVPFKVFEACACYYEPMDFILYLQEDVPYRADRIDYFLTLLWHPYEPHAIGIKPKLDFPHFSSALPSGDNPEDILVGDEA